MLVQELSYKDDKLTLKSKKEHVKLMKEVVVRLFIGTQKQISGPLLCPY